MRTPQRGPSWCRLTRAGSPSRGWSRMRMSRREAEAAVRRLDDVVGVTNLIAMRAGAHGSDAQTSLVDTLHSSNGPGPHPIRTPGRGDPEDCSRLPELIRSE